MFKCYYSYLWSCWFLDMLPRPPQAAPASEDSIFRDIDCDVSPPLLQFPDDLCVTRQSEGYLRGVACWSQEDVTNESESGIDDPISESEPVPNAASSSNSAVRGPLKAYVAPKRAHKYGFCSIHTVPFRLHLVKSGPNISNTSQFWVRCAKFWTRLENGKPTCWQGHAYKGSLDALPKGALRAQKDMRQHTRFQLQQGPQVEKR